MSEQSRLEYVTKLRFTELNFPEIIGVAAFWDDDVVRMKIFVTKDLTEEKQEYVIDAIAEIMAQFSHGVIEDEYVIMSTSYLSPTLHLAYKRL